MSRLTMLILAGAVMGLTAPTAPAAPPPYTASLPPSVRVFPSAPRLVTPTVPRTGGTVIVFPNTYSLRPVVPLTPIIPVRHVYSVYYRVSPFQPWIPISSSYSFWRAELIRDELLFYYGVDAMVY